MSGNRTWWIGAGAGIALAAVIGFEAGVRSAERAGSSGAATTAAPSTVSAPTDSASARLPGGSGISTRLGDADPPAAGPRLPDSIAEISALPTDFTSTYAAYALAARSDERTLLALIDEAKQVERQNDRLALIAIFIGRYGELAPVRALDYIDDSDLDVKPTLVFRVVRAWSKVDLDAAVAAIRTLPTDELKRAASDAILAAYADADEAVLANVRARLSALPATAGVSPQSVLRIAADNPTAALAEVGRLGGQEQMPTASAIGNLWGLRDPEAALAHGRTISDPAVREAFLGGLFAAWMESDSDRVIALLGGAASDVERTAILNFGVVRLAQRDPAHAFERVQSVNDAELRVAALQRVFRTWAQRDPAAAAAALDDVPAEDMANLGVLVGREFALRAPAAALDWVARYDDDFGAAHVTVLTEVAKADPRLALDAAYALANPDYRQSAVAQILGTVGEHGPVAGACYWQQIPPDTRADAAARIAERWQSRDPSAAAGWLLGQPLGADRDAGLGRFIVSAALDLPDIARLVNAVSPDRRDELAGFRIGRLVRAGRIAQAESELAQFALTAEGHRIARGLIDDAGR